MKKDQKKSTKAKAKKPKKLSIKASLIALADRVSVLENHPRIAGAKGEQGEQGERGERGSKGDSFRWWWE